MTKADQMARKYEQSMKVELWLAAEQVARGVAIHNVVMSEGARRWIAANPVPWRKLVRETRLEIEAANWEEAGGG